MILGSGRSGTTWVLDALADANELRPVFEPLHPADSKFGRRYAYRALSFSEKNEELKGWFDDLAAGRKHSRWLDYRAPRDLLFPRPSRLLREPGFLSRSVHGWRKYYLIRSKLDAAIKRDETLIKCIRGNLMAGWIAREAGFRTVLVVRHPCAAVESQFRSEWKADIALERYRGDSRLRELTDGRFETLLRAALTRVQSLTLQWVIENQWPVERSTLDGYRVVHYEDLVHHPDESWPKLTSALGLARSPEPRTLHRPSQQTSNHSLANASQQDWAKPRWLTNLTGSQLTEIQGVLDATECDLYRAQEVMPLARRN